MDKENILEREKEEKFSQEKGNKQNGGGYFGYSASFASLAFIILFILSKTNNIEIDSAKVMMYALIFGRIWQDFIVNKKQRSIWKGLILIAILILMIGYIVDMIS